MKINWRKLVASLFLVTVFLAYTPFFESPINLSHGSFGIEVNDDLGTVRMVENGGTSIGHRYSSISEASANAEEIVNTQIELILLTTPPSGNTAPGGIYPITATLKNKDEPLAGLFFRVVRLEYVSGNTPAPFLNNRDSETPPNVGAELTPSIPGGVLETNETFGITFDIELPLIEPFIAEVDALKRQVIPPTPTIGTVDEGDFADIEITTGSDGLGLISYVKLNSQFDDGLKVAHCENIECTVSTTTNLDQSSNFDGTTSITIGTDGLGIVSYYDRTNGNLKVAHCENLACTSATISTVDSEGDVGRTSSITIGADGLGIVSYLDGTNETLKVAHCENIACTSATARTIDDSITGNQTSIAIGSDGLPLIIYKKNLRLRAAHCSNIACDTVKISTLTDTVNGGRASVAIGSDGHGLISFFRDGAQDLNVVHCDNLDCSDVTISVLDVEGDLAIWNDVAIGDDGLGLIAYHRGDLNDDLKVAHCDNVKCTSGSINTLDSQSKVGKQATVTIGGDGLGLIAYRGETERDLKVAHCGNPLCTPP